MAILTNCINKRLYFLALLGPIFGSCSCSKAPGQRLENITNILPVQARANRRTGLSKFKRCPSIRLSHWRSQFAAFRNRPSETTKLYPMSSGHYISYDLAQDVLSIKNLRKNSQRPTGSVLCGHIPEIEHASLEPAQAFHEIRHALS